MALNFSTAKTELAARGFEDLSDTRLGYFINRGHWMLTDKYPWPSLEKSTTPGASPVTISDLRQILWVVDTTNDVPLEGVDQRTIRDLDPDLTQTGDPEVWYLTGTTVLTVWPVNTTATIAVRYLKRPAVLTGTDSFAIPDEYDYLVVDAAAILAYRNSDNLDAALALRGDWEIDVEAMADNLLNRNYMNTEVVSASGDASVDW